MTDQSAAELARWCREEAQWNREVAVASRARSNELDAKDHDEFAARFTAIADLLERGQGWRPIGEWTSAVGECLVAVDDAVGEGRFHGDEGWYWAGNDPSDSWGRRIFPTHFQPLPAPPSTEKEGQG